MEGLSSSETSIITIATLRNNPEDAILHSHRRENLKSYSKKINSLPIKILAYLYCGSKDDRSRNNK
jgi:hypothetical protein